MELYRISMEHFNQTYEVRRSHNKIVAVYDCLRDHGEQLSLPEILAMDTDDNRRRMFEMEEGGAVVSQFFVTQQETVWVYALIGLSTDSQFYKIFQDRIKKLENDPFVEIKK